MILLGLQAIAAGGATGPHAPVARSRVGRVRRGTRIACIASIANHTCA
jgi:hypothetical protein